MSKLQKEVWKDVPNYEGIYQVSNLGKVKSLHYNKERILKPQKDSNGYYHVRFSKKGKQRLHTVHRLVSLTFIGESKLDVNHINGVKTDNNLSNLEYCTRSQNLKHARDIGLQDNKGQNHGMSKLTEIEVREIKYENKNLTQKEIAEFYNIDKSLVSYIRNGKRWNHI